MKTVSVGNYKRDPLYLRIVRAVGEILAKGNVVTPIDVLIRMHLLTAEQVEDWRFGRIPYLERVIQTNLTRLGRILRILRFVAHDLKLVPSITVYKKWGKGHKHVLRFSKTGDKGVEDAYCRHFIWPGKGDFPLERLRTGDTEQEKEAGVGGGGEVQENVTASAAPGVSE